MLILDNSYDILPDNSTCYNWHKYPDMDIVLYKDITGKKHLADKNATLETLDEYTYAEGNFMHPKKVIIGHKYHIDENAVTKETFNMVKEMLNNININQNAKIYIDNGKIYIDTLNQNAKIYVDNGKIYTDTLNQNGKIRGKRADHVVFDDFNNSDIQQAIDSVTAPFIRKSKENIVKENDTMPNITSYNFYPKQGTTKLTFDDGTTTVVQSKDPETADIYTGFVSAIAKRAMGNKGGMLKAYHKFVEQPEIDKKLAEEKAKREAEEEKKRAEEERKREERETIESLAQSYKEDYDSEEQELVEFQKQLEQAKKLAHDKYGVPYEYFERLDNCCEDCCEDCGCHNTHENTVTDNAESTQSEF